MLVGLDIGTEGIRAVIFNESTQQFDEYKESYKLYFPSINQAVQKPFGILFVLKNILKKLPKTYKTIFEWGKVSNLVWKVQRSSRWIDISSFKRTHSPSNT